MPQTGADNGRSGPLDGQGDFVAAFRLESANIRGRIVRLGPVIDEILNRHAYPLTVSQLVGEATALVTLIGSGMKFDGRLTLQTRGSGPVSMIVADYMTPGQLRGYALFDAAAVGRLPKGAPLRDILGDGHLSITLDQGPNMDRYQGIVALEGETLAECCTRYLHQSEQIESFLRLAVAQSFFSGEDRRKRHWRVGGIMLQHIPPGGRAFLNDDGQPIHQRQDDDWVRARYLAVTVEDHELIDPSLAHERLLYRLFHEEGVSATPPAGLVFGCSCSRERAERILREYPPEDYPTMVEEGLIRVSCEFCSRAYRFDPQTLTDRGAATPAD